MKRLITAAAATYALVLTVGGCSSKTAVPTSSTKALNSTASSSSSKLSPQAQATVNFPKASCGDNSTAANDTWYPVFVDAGDLKYDSSPILCRCCGYTPKGYENSIRAVSEFY
jgi:hypothetical protein